MERPWKAFGVLVEVQNKRAGLVLLDTSFTLRAPDPTTARCLAHQVIDCTGWLQHCGNLELHLVVAEIAD